MRYFIIKIIPYIIIFLPFLVYSQSDSLKAAADFLPGATYHVANNTTEINSDGLLSSSTFVQAANPTSNLLYTAYKNFTQKKMDEVVSQLTQNGFKKQVFKSIELEPQGSVDSLIFNNTDSVKIIFTMVDLGYLKSVKAFVRLKVDSPEQVLQEFEQLLVNDGLALKNDSHIPNIFTEFQSIGEYWIVDSRWKNKTYTKFESLYHFIMTSYDGYFVLRFSEIVPLELAPLDKIHVDNLEMDGKIVSEIYK
ncbi:hypothetical protein [Reichenbachiella sp. MALMAid0571]|uniref:hypothetical protein n=1 Tax=Reichenbachiella sp. MALMAid0571 TaxID=3143939 RepID=UPI0032DED03F